MTSLALPRRGPFASTIVRHLVVAVIGAVLLVLMTSSVSAYRNFQIVFTVLTLNFVIPALSYTFAPREAMEQFLAVNISPAALADKEVMGMLDDADLRRVIVEITEHEAVEDYALTRVVIGRLRAADARSVSRHWPASCRGRFVCWSQPR